jgi:twitching motility protein PilT
VEDQDRGYPPAASQQPLSPLDPAWRATPEPSSVAPASPWAPGPTPADPVPARPAGPAAGGAAPSGPVAQAAGTATAGVAAAQATAPPVPPQAPPGDDRAGQAVRSETRSDSGASTRLGADEVDNDDVPILVEMLLELLEVGGSDLHITSGAPPTIRLHGTLTPLENRPVLTPPMIQRMMYAILTQKQREKFEERLELDFSYAVPGKARFRVNLYRQRDSLGAAFRLIPYEIKELATLGIPPSVANFAMLPRGFVLVTGPTGSGKSTTLASLVDLANRTRREHIMTVEDPIEFLHQHKACLVNQREVGEDTHSFQEALKHVLRQDPDIILVGEMRDLETIQVALTAAETGHLVFATLHTQDAAQSVDRVIDVFPPHQQQQVRVQLAGSLQGIVSQTLCKTADGRGRVVATEVLVATPAIRNLIREGKTHQIYSSLQAGARHGMHTMDQHLSELVRNGRITYEAALEKCHHVEDFNRLCGRTH